MSHSSKQVLVRLGVVALVMVLAVGLVTTAFATALRAGELDSDTAPNVAPQNAGISVSATSRTPGQSLTASANYTFGSTPQVFGSLAAGFTGGFLGSTTIGTAWMQFTHSLCEPSCPTSVSGPPRWFMLAAGNAAASQAAGSPAASAGLGQNTNINYFYYTRPRGIVHLGIGSAQGNLGAGTVNSILFLDGTATSRVPAFTVQALSFSVGPQASTGATGTTATCTGTTSTGGITATAPCSATFAAQLRWGVAQQGFPGGSMNIRQAVESVPAFSSSGIAKYSDAWENATAVTLNNTAPALSAAAVTGSRPVETANVQISVAGSDTNSNLLQLGALFVLPDGRWFHIKHVNTDNNDNTITVSNAGFTCYRSNSETEFCSTGGTAFGAMASVTAVSVSGDAAGETVTFTVRFSAVLEGRTATAYAFAGDFAGGTTGIVQQGTMSFTARVP